MSVTNDGTGRDTAIAAFDQMGAGDRMTARQVHLNHLWGFFRAEQYAHRSIAWDGTPAMPTEQRAAVAHAGFIPPGFEGNPDQTLSLRYRRPDAPYHLGRVIVERFTGLLFSQRRHPIVRTPGDTDTEDMLTAICDEGRLWSKMVLARNYGGAMGSVAVGFKLDKGRPVFEVFDPRWCIPQYLSRAENTLRKLEVRYVYYEPVVTFDEKKNRVVEQRPFFYRRVIDTQSDEVWEGVPADKGEPNWNALPSDRVEHGIGECPAVWIQNQEVQDAIDGDPDAHGAFDMMEQMDALISQANRGVLSNCDPTLLIVSEDELPEGLKKGSNNALKITKGTASYMEMNGQGPRAALELAERFEKLICRMARVVIDQSSSQVAKTATEIDRDYSSMLEKADVLREQYGERGIKRLLRIVIKVCKEAMKPKVVEGVGVVRQVMDLPMRSITDPKTGERTFVPRKFGESDHIVLAWGPYFQPTLSDANTAVQASGMAKEKGLVDAVTATKFIAPYFGLDDAAETISQIKKDADEEMAKMEEMARRQMAMQKEMEADSSEESDEEEPEDDAALEDELAALDDELAGLDDGEEPPTEDELPSEEDVPAEV